MDGIGGSESVLGWDLAKSKKGIRELFICLWAASTRARLLGQVGTDMNDVVGDHSESDPAFDAVRSFVE